MHAAKKPKCKFKFVTLDEDSNMSTLWRREEFLRAQNIEVTIPVSKVRRHGTTSIPRLCSSIVLEAGDLMGSHHCDSQIIYFLEFERSTDRDERFL